MDRAGATQSERLSCIGILRLLINFSYTPDSAPPIVKRSTVMSSTATQSNAAPMIRPGIGCHSKTTRYGVSSARREGTH